MQLKNADAKYAKLIDETAQAKKNFRLRILLLELKQNTGGDCIAQLENNLEAEVAERKDVHANRSGAYGFIRILPQK